MPPGVLDPDDYAAAQDLGEALRSAGSDGVVYPSVRHDVGHCIGILWPDVAGIPVQGNHYDYHWNGNRVDYIRRHSDPPKLFELTP
ncbi:MAG: RES family NAD+ phosphorylase [Pseudomonadota bacterium]